MTLSFTAGCWFFNALLLSVVLVVVPTAHAAAIVACDGIASGPYNGQISSSGGYTINSWGYGPTACYGSLVTGLPSLSSFTYWLRTTSYDAPSTTAVGVVLNSTNGVVASVDITGLLPDVASGAYSAVTANFGSIVSLNASLTYKLAFCATGGGATEYIMDGTTTGDSFRYCQTSYAACTTSAATWEDYNGSSLRSNITGSCGPASSSASQLAPWGALALVAARLTALWTF